MNRIFRWISSLVGLKIATALFIILSLIMAVATFLLVTNRSEALRQQMTLRARAMTVLGARSMSVVLEQALRDGTFSAEQLFDTDYRPITSGPLASSALPKFHTAYDSFLDERIQPLEDTVLEQDESVLFAVLVDRNGYLPTHNSRYSRALTGDPEQDRAGNRTKQIFADPVGLAAARYQGADGDQVLRQEYHRDTGELVWDFAAPVTVQGQHWGAFRVGFSIARMEQEVTQLRNTLLLAVGVIQAIIFFSLWFVLTYFVRPLKRLTEVAERLANGQLDQQIVIETRDEIGQLGQAFNRMTQVIFKDLEMEVEKSGHLVVGVKETIQQLSSSANQLMAISAQQAAGSNQQASAVQEATTTAAEIATTARQVADSALRVEEFAVQSGQAGDEGMVAVESAVAGMRELKEQVQSIAEAMLELTENSEKIGGIVNLIDDISDQTNLLALNAAIEAAGAGEAGKRFTIVANEVKRLAQRTVVATGQIKALVTASQQATRETTRLSHAGSTSVDEASRLVTRIAEKLAKILAMVKETTGAAREIKLSTQQQTTASDQMAETITEVRDVATQVAASADEMSLAISDLTALAEQLRNTLEAGLQEKGKVKAANGARMMETVLEDALRRGLFSPEELFDENYRPIPDTNPQKYHTCYDRFLDANIRAQEDSFLADPQVVFAVLADRNGYIPTHNSRYTQPLTGDLQQDRLHNRTKRLFNDPVGLAAARNNGEILIQTYHRDTGEKMWDISAPVTVAGRHWGAFRIGYTI
ncbi:methyl-accepting chemotaxis protein [Desulfuromonas carbonis]|uniref:methyl-accepting chemotaxis protein n=1 Tax=Desulfuromonas sp. DDH964 TaxID=1823759 RepID=UPI00078CE5A5|nr:methyl-accepting chemotaxis protein [Desulfuromonas sp. DDH964]AMV73824.1 methyl-accepting chemotaxis protein [Desulfuromonas sp. DDH964]